MSVQVSYKKQFVLGILFLLVVLVVVEGIVRIYENFNPGCKFIGSDVFENTDDFLVAQICQNVYALSYEKSTIQLIAPDQHFPTININSYGFRGPEIIKEKPEDVYRIFVVGGSTALGTGSTSDSTTISGFLQKKFNDANLNGRVEVINAGIPGAYSLSETYYIKNMLLEFDPDLFIIYDGANDARYRKMNLEITNGDQEKIEFKIATLIPFYRTPFLIYHHFFEPDIPEGDVAPDRCFLAGGKCPPINDEITSSIILMWKTRLLEICELGKKEDFQTQIALQPMVGSGDKNLTAGELRFAPHTEHGYGVITILEGMATSLGELAQTCEKTTDLRDVFSNVSEPVFFDDLHMSDFGSEIIAQKLFESSLPLVQEKLN